MLRLLEHQTDMLQPTLQLVASGPGVGKVSEPLTLTCAVSGVSIASQDHVWYWLRHPGNGLEWMGLIDSKGDTAYAPSFQSRIIISRDTSKNQFYFQLRSLTSADSATYRCARR
uniref:Ig-like domain-containing protein n=1 Tax=Chrysemys picta bellii TaxID=8478 RepID=A0A8C3IF79_CHRPI